jgi:hypothetical protein
VLQPSTSSSTWPPRRPVSDLFPTTFRLGDLEWPVSRSRNSNSHAPSHR